MATEDAMPTGRQSGMRRDFTVVVERDEDGNYVASVPALAGCHTQARSLDELVKRTQEAIALCLEDGADTALPVLEFVGVQRVTVPA
jgi:predicted RNase H-like HicB family nuclease